MYELVFSDEEIGLVLNALDFYSRIWIGQYDHILWEIRWLRNCYQLDQVEEKYRQQLTDMRNIILPELHKFGLSGSYGIFSPDRNVKAAIAYDMQQEFRYRRAWFKNPDGGYTVEFGRPLPCDDDPCDFPKAECYNVDGEFFIKITIDSVQIKVIVDALKVAVLGYSGQIDKMFEYYTDDADALRIAQKITSEFLEIELERPLDDSLYCNLINRLVSNI